MTTQKGTRNADGRARARRLALRVQPDARLVALTREGSDAAFEQIVARYRERLVSYAAGIAPPGRAEDVVQESLVRALVAIRRDRRAIELRPWLYRVVRNRALNDLRDEPVHQRLDESQDGVPQPPEAAAQRERLADVVAALRELPAAQRSALVSRELEGLSHEDIARRLALTPNAVRGLIFRARATLRDAVGALIPMPALRALVDSPASAGPVVAAAGGAGAGAKVAVALTVAAVAIGPGLALKTERPDPTAAGRPDSHASVNEAPPAGELADVAELAPVPPAAGSGEGEAEDDHGSGGSSGPGSDSSGRGDSSGPGSSGDGDGGSGSGGGSSGPGGGGELTVTSDGSSGPGSGDVTLDSSGDGSSGSSGDLTTSGSGATGSGSGSDGGSGSGSSGPG